MFSKSSARKINRKKKEEAHNMAEGVTFIEGDGKKICFFDTLRVQPAPSSDKCRL
jgi:hypothetical protein